MTPQHRKARILAAIQALERGHPNYTLIRKWTGQAIESFTDLHRNDETHKILDELVTEGLVRKATYYYLSAAGHAITNPLGNVEPSHPVAIPEASKLRVQAEG